MPDYKKLYFKLFAAIADAVDEPEHGQPFPAKEHLISAQQEAEEEYISEDT